MKPRKRRVAARFNVKSFLAKTGAGRAILDVRQKQALFSQGDLADAVFYILKGKIKLTVLSRHGKEAVIAMLGLDDFFGEGCLAGQPLRMATAMATTDGSIMKIEKKTVVSLLHNEPTFSDRFMAYVLSRNVRIEEDLVDQLFNSSEKRLARTLLLLAHVGKDREAEVVVPKISQESLAEIVGTTRARVSSFMNRFRQLGFIEYNGELRVHSALLNVVLHD
jgi:CRP/FNR family transcriptional regulator, cyclic AMP receptor protein